MNKEDFFDAATGSYNIVAWARGQKVVYFESFGDFEGEWVLVSKDSEKFYVYKGWYGSCSGCDDFQMRFDYDQKISLEKAKEFANEYPPFCEIPWQVMLDAAREGKVLEFLPCNIRGIYSEMSLMEVAEGIAKKVLEMENAE